LAHKEIAERMSLSVSSVEKYLLKGVLECRAFVQEQEGGLRYPEQYTEAKIGRDKGSL